MNARKESALNATNNLIFQKWKPTILTPGMKAAKQPKTTASSYAKPTTELKQENNKLKSFYKQKHISSHKIRF